MTKLKTVGLIVLGLIFSEQLSAQQPGAMMDLQSDRVEEKGGKKTTVIPRTESLK